MSKLGLVFSGGGGKGAYEIGVWKALKELGIDQNVEAVAGTSVGALNGALFIQGDYEVGENLWRNITPDKIMKVNATNIATKVAELAVKLSIPETIILDSANKLAKHGWFSQKGLKQLIADSNVCAAVKASKIPFHVCTLNGNSSQIEIPQINGRPKTEIEKWLLAASAIPIFFGSIKIKGQHYHDGGVLPFLSNNTPYQPLIERHKCTHIISIFLDNAPLMRKEQQKYSNISFWNIVPPKQFKGKSLASLNFDADNARNLIERGYADTKNILMPFREFQKNEERTNKSVVNTQKAQANQDKQIEINRKIRVTIQVSLQPKLSRSV